ncbi:DUF2089 family protein [Flagellimonas onchidii]|uniref:DUF2089 family protein n=1 Tax=Flagellimonas onchidii TaxID=2562684 RepID=UPI0010A66C44|nr:DUF2089 family protein [Allomuricauda onchidii]
MNKKLPLSCPSCENLLQVKQLYCDQCETTVTGLYSLPIISQLSMDEQKFILDFVKTSGSLKDMAKKMKLSYPTVRNRLDDIIGAIEKLEADGE